MTRALLLLGLLSLAGCKDELTTRPEPVALTADAVGYYCQMELLDHEGPKGQIHLDGFPAPIFFGQVRDAIAYLQMPEQDYAIRAVYVQDMAGSKTWASPGDWIDAERAFYVVGSNQLGGMGAPEFVPFSEERAAQDFASHRGGTVRNFEEVAEADMVAPTSVERADEADIASRLRVLQQPAGVN